MCFRNLITLIFISLTIFGCAKRNVPANEPIVIELKGAGTCLTGMMDTLSRFTNGTLSSGEVSDFWNCMATSIQDFERLTAGNENPDQYSAEALRQFILHYFLKNDHISDAMLSGLMEVKRVLLSGNTHMVTRGELIKLNSLFTGLKAVTLDLQPHARVLFRAKTKSSDVEVRQAADALQVAMMRIGTWLNRENQNYNFSDLAQLINEFNRGFGKTDDSAKIMDNLQKAVLVLPEVKSVLIGGNKGKVAGQEWLALCNAISRGAYAYLAIFNGADVNLDAAFNRETVPESAALIVDVLAGGVRGHAAGEISLSEWKDLFASIEKTGWLPAGMTASGLNSLWVWLLRRPLGDGTTEPTGMNLGNLAILHRQIDNWLTLLNTPADDPSPLVGQFNQNLNASRPITWDSQGRMEFLVKKQTAWSAESRRHMAWEFAILRWLKDSYAGSEIDFLTEDQMNLAAHEILPLLQNFGWLTATKETIGKRLLREADLFTQGCNGDGHLDMYEAVRLLAFVSSSYRTAQVWLESAKTVCGSAQPVCVRSMAERSGSTVLTAMPRLTATTSKWKSGKFVLYMQHSEQTALGNIEIGDFTASDLLQTVQVFQYVETVVQNFDADSSESIDLAEALNAFQIYGPTLGKLLPISNDDLTAFFTFMMKYGETPFPPTFGGQIEYLNWRLHRDTWAFAAERDTLMSILSELSKL